MIRIRPSMPGDYWLFLDDLRQVEVDEFAALGTDSEHCMRLGLLAGGARTVFINEEPAAMFGIVDYGDYNFVWAVFTRAIERHPIAFLRESKRLADSFDREVVNYVDARNLKAVKWFQWLGFEVSDPEPYGPKGLLFHRFTNRSGLKHLEGAMVEVPADGEERKVA
jgi:hypothetical protein